MTDTIATRFDATNFAAMKICAIGGGSMGPGTALSFAEKGCEVSLFVRSQERLDEAMQALDTALAVKVAHGLLAADQVAAIKARITPFVGSRDDAAVNKEVLRHAAGKADLVIESIDEKLHLKQALFDDLNDICPSHTVFASNSSSLDPTDMAAQLPDARRANVIGMHYWNPPHLLRLVELVNGRETSQQVSEFMYQLTEWLGKKPVPMRFAIPGLGGNRMQLALLREFYTILAEGQYTAAEIDEEVQETLAIDWARTGPLKGAMMMGQAAVESMIEEVEGLLGNDTGVPALLTEAIATKGQNLFSMTPEQITELKTARVKRIVDHLGMDAAVENGTAAVADYIETGRPAGRNGKRAKVALLREALYMLSLGVATAEEIDTIYVQSLGRRLEKTGPGISSHVGGHPIFGNIFSTTAAHLCNETGVTAPLLSKAIASGQLKWDAASAEDARARLQPIGVVPPNDRPAVS